MVRRRSGLYETGTGPDIHHPRSYPLIINANQRHLTTATPVGITDHPRHCTVLYISANNDLTGRLYTLNTATYNYAPLRASLFRDGPRVQRHQRVTGHSFT